MSDEVEVMSDEAADYHWSRRHRMLQRVEISTLYHRKRERFFDRWEKLTNVTALIAGSTAFGQALSCPVIVRIFGAITAAAAIVALVYGFAEKARRHASFAAEFKTLEGEIRAAGEYPSIKQLDAWEARIARIESGEGAPMRALAVICQNEIAIAQGNMRYVTSLPIGIRLFAQYIDFDVSRFDPPAVKDKSFDEPLHSSP